MHWKVMCLFAMAVALSVLVICTSPSVEQDESTLESTLFVNGREYILLTPHLRTMQSSTRKQQQQEEDNDEETNADSSLQETTNNSTDTAEETKAAQQQEQDTVISQEEERRSLLQTSKTTSSSSSSSSRGHLFVTSFVGFVALLMGAATAKRVTKQVWVNDSRLDKELAYDIAYTNSPVGYGFASVNSEVNYGSFVASWAGDLEKFDV